MMYKEFKTQMSYALLGMDAEKSITITNPPTSGKVSGSVTLGDMKYMISTAEDKELLIRALYVRLLRKVMNSISNIADNLPRHIVDNLKS